MSLSIFAAFAGLGNPVLRSFWLSHWVVAPLPINHPIPVIFHTESELAPPINVRRQAILVFYPPKQNDIYLSVSPLVRIGLANSHERSSYRSRSGDNGVLRLKFGKLENGHLCATWDNVNVSIHGNVRCWRLSRVLPFDFQANGILLDHTIPNYVPIFIKVDAIIDKPRAQLRDNTFSREGVRFSGALKPLLPLADGAQQEPEAYNGRDQRSYADPRSNRSRGGGALLGGQILFIVSSLGVGLYALVDAFKKVGRIDPGAGALRVIFGTLCICAGCVVATLAITS